METGKRRYTTESGSVYDIDFDQLTWKRQRGEGASEIRTDDGTFFDFEIIEDQGLVLYCLTSMKHAVRVISSTPIVKVEVIDDSELRVNRPNSHALN